MPKSKLSGTMHLRSRPVFEVIYEPTDGKKTSLGIKSRPSCNLVNTLHMFGKGAISSLESPAGDGSSPTPSFDPDRALPEVFFSFWELSTGEGSLPVVRSVFRPQETKVIRGSLVDLPTAPLSYNPEPELARPATSVPYLDPESSTNPVSSFFWGFWTALISCPDPDLVIAHVRIW